MDHSERLRTVNYILAKYIHFIWFGNCLCTCGRRFTSFSDLCRHIGALTDDQLQEHMIETAMKS